MAVNIGPKIGVDGEAEYRAQINNIIQQARTLNSQMKVLEAGFDGTTSAQEKAAAVADILSKQIQVQRQRVSALENMLDKSANALGENDTKTLRWQQAVNEANAELTRMEHELQEAESQLEDTGDALDNAGDEADNAGDKFASFTDILGANFLADAALDMLREVGEELKDFAVESLDTAADVKAANAQFSQTFKDMEKQATKSLESIEKKARVAATRMQSSYTSVYAFSKSVGADSAEALDIANRAMLAAADSAAYYDKSIEGAAETLQSFLKGNYENDAALGIAATETTRNAKANEMYATSFDKLSEAQKVDVLLAMVEAGNEASGALGQAAREAGEWTNVTGEAAEAMRMLQAEIGKPAIKLLTPIIQDATAAINEMIKASAADELAENMDEVVDAWEAAEEQFSSSVKEIEANAIMAEYFKERLVELEEAGLDTAEAQREYANTIGQLNDLYPEMNLQIDEQTGLLDENSRAQLSNLDAMKQRAMFAAQEEHYTAALKVQADAIVAVQEAEYARVGVRGQIQSVSEQLTASTGLEAAKLMELYNSTMSANFMLQTNGSLSISAADGANTFGAATRNLTAEEMALLEQLHNLTAEETDLTNQIDVANGVVEEQDAILSDLAEAYGITSGEITKAAGAQDQMGASAEAVTAQIEALEAEYAAAQESARKSIDSQIGYFDELKVKSDKSAKDIIKNWGDQKQAFENYSANLQKAVDMGLDEALVQQLSDGSTESMAILNEFVNSTDVSVDEINDAFGKMSESRDEVASVMTDINTDINEKLNAAKAAANAAGTQIPAGLAAGINSRSGLVTSAMTGLATAATNAFNKYMIIKSPSRRMKDSGENTAKGAAIGVDENAALFEKSMRQMAMDGRKAFADFGSIDSMMYIDTPSGAYGGGTASNSYTFGDMTIQINQQPGEDADALAYRVMDLIQMEVSRMEAGIGA